MKELKDNKLNAVNGGDYGDWKKERSDTPYGVKFLYNVGDHVEIYRSGSHICTYGGTIVERKVTTYSDGCSTYYIGNYKVHLDKGGDYWQIADEIESS